MTGGRAFHFVHPGPVSQMSGGTLYDLRVIEALRGSGWTVDLHELPGRFPDADDKTMAAAERLLAGIPSGASVVFDGLALPAFANCFYEEGRRLSLTALVHHPTSDETGLTTVEREQLFEIEKQTFSEMRRIVVPSPAMGRRLAAFGVDSTRIEVAEPGVEPAARAVGSPGGTAAALLCVASLTARKGHLALLDALSGCRDLDWHLTCAGPLDSESKTTASVSEAISRLGLADQVRLIGPQVGKDLDALYAAADVFVLASRYEGYGMVFAEAMARGLPIVASGDGAVADTVPDAAGIVVPAGDRGALSDALRRMISDVELRQRKADGSWAAGQGLPRWPDTAARFARAIESGSLR